MSSSDFKYMMSMAVFLVLWVGFMGLYSSGNLTASQIAEYHEDSSLLSTLKLSTSFMNPFSDAFQSDIAIINILIFPILGFGLLITGLRYLRGQ